MATPIHLDIVGGNDANNGTTWALAKATLAGASAVCDANGHIKVKGNQWTPLTGTVTWAHDSTSVVFTTNPALSVGDFIYPANGVDFEGKDCAAPFQVASGPTGGGPYTYTLRSRWQGANGNYTTVKLALQTWTAQTMSGGTTGQKITFGWNSTTDTQNADYRTCPYITAGPTLLSLDQAATLLDPAGLLICPNYNAAAIGLAFTANGRILGTLRGHGAGAAQLVYINTAALIVEIGDVIFNSGTAGKAAVAVTTSGLGLNIRMGRIFCHNGRAFICGRQVVCTIDEALEFRGGTSITLSTMVAGGDNCRVGRLYIRNGTTPPLVTATCSSSKLLIGRYDADIAAPTGVGVQVGGPIASGLLIGPNDTVTRATDRNGVANAALKIDATSFTAGANGRRPGFSPVMFRPVTAGRSATLKFYAVYTGTESDVPECWIELVEPNGYKVQAYTFTPPQSANTPGGSPDGWLDATQQTIALTGTAAVDGNLAFRVCCVDNAAANSILYVCSFTWVMA